jgi:hypothetical protein
MKVTWVEHFYPTHTIIPIAVVYCLRANPHRNLPCFQFDRP